MIERGMMCAMWTKQESERVNMKDKKQSRAALSEKLKLFRWKTDETAEQTDPHPSPWFPFRVRREQEFGELEACIVFVYTLYQLLHHHSSPEAHPARPHTIRPWRSLSPPYSVWLPSSSLQPDDNNKGKKSVTLKYKQFNKKCQIVEFYTVFNIIIKSDSMQFHTSVPIIPFASVR